MTFCMNKALSKNRVTSGMLILCLFIGISFSGEYTFRDKYVNANMESELLLQDLDSFYTVTTKRHKAFAFCDSSHYQSEYRRIRDEIVASKEYSIGNFYSDLASLLHLMKDEHSMIVLPDNSKIREHSTAVDPIVIPLELLVVNNKVYVYGSNEIPLKSELLKIADIEALEFVKNIFQKISYQKFRYLERNGFGFINLSAFSPSIYGIYGISDTMSLSYRDRSGVVEMQLALESLNTRLQIKNLNCYMKQKEPVELLYMEGIPVLRINEMNVNEARKIYRKYEEYFAEISNDKHLVIDISLNEGGSDHVWTPIPWFIGKDSFKFTPLSNESNSFLKLKQRYYKASRRVSKKRLKRLKNQKRFTGDVYLFVGLNTFSSASNFADALKYNNSCTLIGGVEPSGFLPHHGSIQLTTLENTKIKVYSSTKLIPSVGRGVMAEPLQCDVPYSYKTLDEFIADRESQTLLRAFCTTINKKMIKNN